MRGDELVWIEDLLPEGFFRKAMFGGKAYYVDGLLVLVLFAKVGDKSYRGRSYPFEIWNGCLFPTDREHHKEIQKLFPQLVAHPVLGKWLYLHQDQEDFETVIVEISKLLRRRSALFGIVPQPKRKKVSKKAKKKTKKKIQAAADVRRNAGN